MKGAVGALPAAPAPGALGSWLRWAKALGATVLAAPRAVTAEDPAAVLSAWSRRMLSALAIEVEWASAPPEAPLWVANHLSWLDPAVLFAHRPMGTLAKAEVAEYPLVGRAARRAGLHFVQREDPTSRAAALAAFSLDLGRGRPMLLFPEGTTTRGAALAPLHPGGLLAAHRLGLPTLAVRISSPDAHYPWVEDDELLPHLDTLTRLRRTRVHLRPGPLLHPSDFPDPDAWVAVLRHHLLP